MVAAAADYQKMGQKMFLSPSEMKSLQNKLQVMTNGHHHHLGGVGSVGSAGNSPNGSGSERSGSSSSSLTVRSTHVSPTSPGAVATSYSNGYHHHPPRNGHSPHNLSSDRHHESTSSRESRARDAYFTDKLHHHPLHNGGGPSIRIPVDQIIPSHFLEQRIRTGSEPNSPAASESLSESGSSLSPVPFLQEAEIIKLADAAAQIVKSLPPYVFEPQLPPKKKVYGDFEVWVQNH
jgi:hypothetical protein